LIEENLNTKGLNDQQVAESRAQFGENKIEGKKRNQVLAAILSILKEPMILLLLAASTLYFFSGKTGDAIFLSSSILLVSAISLYQDSRSRNAIAQLQKLTNPLCKVIRNGKTIEVVNTELVVGDYIILEEGTSISADGQIIQAHDFTVNESILTGESLAISKNEKSEDAIVYSGSTVASGSATVMVTAIGNQTKLGIIGKSLDDIGEEKTPLEIKINNFVKKLVIAGAIVFVLFWLLNFLKSHDILGSLLQALTLAMSILPEEIPVAFSTFMALGAWRMMKMGVLVKQMKTVETLGSASVICLDKTGTITQNKMSIAQLYVLNKNEIVDFSKTKNPEEEELLSIAMWASEQSPFDQMEIAIHNAYQESIKIDLRQEFEMVHEYALGGIPPMMTHIFKNKENKYIIAAKGSPEAMMLVSHLNETDTMKVELALKEMANKGFRVLGIGESMFENTLFPETQQEFKFKFLGLVAFYDPPKPNIAEVFKKFHKAGIKIKIITGDNAQTTAAIASQIGFISEGKSLTGDQLMAIPDNEIQKTVLETSIFSRMYPEAKLRIINELKAAGQIVAMTGDGVNDGPALKAAHIGIAMGSAGSELAKDSASLILTDDDLSKMVDAIAMGRRIYVNLKKAIQYIISIHIPIILTVLLPLMLGWIYPNIFSPVHVIFLELIMGPTCSIIYENEPMEKDTMEQKPRPFSSTFFNTKELILSIVQGLFITAGTLSLYQYSVHMNYDEATTRTMVYVALITSNIFLTLVSRSHFFSVFSTLKNKNNLLLFTISATIAITALILLLPPVNRFFLFSKISLPQLAISAAFGFVFVIWFEIFKSIKRRKQNRSV
jgi:Ca2+-transporting ATPase